MILITASMQNFIAREKDVALVDILEARGSAPRDAGARMLVSKTAICGTIGGGVLEFMAIDQARNALSDKTSFGESDVPLGAEIGQCCGGRVRFRVQKVTRELENELQQILDSEQKLRKSVYIFGAGHVGAALADALSLLPFKTIIVDTREAMLSAVPTAVEKRLIAIPESIIEEAPDGSAFVVLTHDHALDFLITKAVLDKNLAAYAGMIGSKTKRKKFENWYRREGGNVATLSNLVCPIGSSCIDDKRPEVIAALVAAEIVTRLGKQRVRKDARINAEQPD